MSKGEAEELSMEEIVSKLLAEPFPDDFVEEMIVPIKGMQPHNGLLFGKILHQVDARHYQERLDKVFRIDHWDLAYEATPPIVRCCLVIETLTGKKITREDVSSHQDARIAATEAFKRACASLGIGRYLYLNKPTITIFDESGLAIDRDLRWPSNPADKQGWQKAAKEFLRLYALVYDHEKMCEWLMDKHGKVIKDINALVSEKMYQSIVEKMEDIEKGEKK